MLFSRDIPIIVRNDLSAAADDFLDKISLFRRDIDGFICHHGGAKVIDVLEEVFNLPGAALVRRSPFCYLRHPKNSVVAGEITVLPPVIGV